MPQPRSLQGQDSAAISHTACGNYEVRTLGTYRGTRQNTCVHHHFDTIPRPDPVPDPAPRPATRDLRPARPPILFPPPPLASPPPRVPQLAVTYLVGSSALLPPAPPDPEPPTVLAGLFGLFTLTNHRVDPIVGWQLAWMFADPPLGAELANFRGALPLAIAGSPVVRAVNTPSTASVDGAGGVRSFSFNFAQMPGAANTPDSTSSGSIAM